jgi:hypothetical protein
MYHILNNKIILQYGGLSKQLGKRMYLSAFTYILLLIVYSLETAGFLSAKETLVKLKKDSGFFAIFIAFSAIIPFIMLILVFAVSVKKSAESYVNYFIWGFMLLHLGLTLAAYIIGAPDVTANIRGFTYTRLILIFIAMALAIQGGKVHNNKSYSVVSNNSQQ